MYHIVYTVHVHINDTLYQNDILCCLMITVHKNVHPIINMIYPDDIMVPNS